MNSHRVGDVMTPEVVRARRTTSFDKAVRLLDRHRISGLPVVDHDDKVIGVISRTGLLRMRVEGAGGGRGPAVTAQHLMTSPAITVHPEQKVPDAARLMERQGVGRLPVVDEEDRLVGIVTRRDLLRVFLRSDEHIRLEVLHALMAEEPSPEPAAVAVHVRDGLVTLRGRVELRTQVPRALYSSWRVEGVVGVVSFLTYRVDDSGAAAT
ncbi:CBS domain-containing protein [Streptomyces sp. NPDC004783]|uniref:CBS domain-containing protein n=1 Tax=unclassified Streptomyces TaxID=2593676 RepID=UPI0033B37023